MTVFKPHCCCVSRDWSEAEYHCCKSIEIRRLTGSRIRVLISVFLQEIGKDGFRYGWNENRPRAFLEKPFLHHEKATREDSGHGSSL